MDVLNNAVSFLQQLRLENPIVFWGAVAVAGLLVLLLIIVGIRKAVKNKAAKSPGKAENEPKVFVPMESPDEEISAEFLTMQDKILNSDDGLGKKLKEQLRNKGPQALTDIISVYENASPSVQQDLKELVRKERFMERYSRRLDRPEYSQGVLVDAWKYFANQDTLKDFMEMLAAPDDTTQMAGASLLSSLKDPQSLPMLSAALMWPEHFLPARVAEVFAVFGEPGARLLAYLLPKVEDQNKARVLDTIAKIGKPYPPENVIACLTHEDPQIRSAAAMALGSGRMTEAVAPLMLISSDRDWHVRAAIAKALGMIGDRRAISVLDVMAQDTEGWVGESAKASLELFSAV